MKLENVRINMKLDTLLFIIFATLKLTGQIDWSWWWVTAPIWIPVALMVSVVAIIGIFMLIGKYMMSLMHNSKRRWN